jgi:hypothetical protein
VDNADWGAEEGENGAITDNDLEANKDCGEPHALRLIVF